VLGVNCSDKQMDAIKVSAVEIIYKQLCSLHSVEDKANKSAIYFYAVTRFGHICAVPCRSLTFWLRNYFFLILAPPVYKI
jgi:hypothetical protein